VTIIVIIVILSVLTLAELRYGIERMAAGNRRTRLDLWLREELPLRFEGRILSVDAPVANTWGRVMALSKATGRTMSIMDAFLAATAEVHQLILVTRNVADFSVLAASVMNPWSA